MQHPNIAIPPPFFFAIALLLSIALDQFLVAGNITRKENLVTLLFYIGWMITLLGTGLSIWSILTFRKANTAIMPNKPADTLVRTGPYRWSRNPMYVSLFMVYTGLALIYNSAYALMLLPLLFLLFNLVIIPREEKHLKYKFPKAFARYNSETRRWL